VSESEAKITLGNSHVVMGNHKVVFPKLFRFQCGCGEELGYLDIEVDFEKLDPSLHVLAVQMIQQGGMNLVLPRGERHGCLRMVPPTPASRAVRARPRSPRTPARCKDNACAADHGDLAEALGELLRRRQEPVKSQGAIQHKLKQVVTRHLHKILDRNLRERPENCRYNEIRQGEGTLGVGVCGYTDIPYGQLCDRRFGGVEVAKTCGFFTPRYSKEEIKARFEQWLTTASMGEIASKFPDVAALMWVLNETEGDRDIELEVTEDTELPPGTAELDQARQTIAEQETQIDQLNRTVGQKDRIIEQLKNSDGNEGRFLFRGDQKKDG